MNPLMRLKRDKVEEVLMFEDEIMKLNKEEEEQRFSYRRRQARVILIPCICVSIMVGFVAQHHFTIDKKKRNFRMSVTMGLMAQHQFTPDFFFKTGSPDDVSNKQLSIGRF